MKNKIIYTIMAISFMTNAFAQAYIPFVKEGKEWTEYWENNDIPIWHGIDKYVIQGDTIFNNKTYKKVYATTHNGNLIKYIYEDTTNKKVYFYDSTHQKDSLMYDFNLQVGDTFVNVCNAIITDRTLVYFAGINRIRLTFDNNEYICWYEGIGSINGIFQHPCIITGGDSYSLLCYFEDSTLLYHNSSVLDTCFGATQIKELQPDNQFNSYFYNHILYVKPAKPFSYTITIYNIFGRKVTEIYTNGDIELNLSSLQNGLYIYRIESNDKQINYGNKLIFNQ